MNIFGFEIRSDDEVPEGEVWFVRTDGAVVEKIVNIGKVKR